MTRMVLDQGIQGDLVECGVFAGAQVAAMARACIDAGEIRKVHLFDSFAGIPKAGQYDNDIHELVGLAGSEIESSGVSVCSVEQVESHMIDWQIPASMLVYHPGWFQDTVPTAGIDVIAMLRLDGDLYESTKVCMDHLYPKLSRGGVCIADDYALDGCRKAVNEALGGYIPGPVYWSKN